MHTSALQDLTTGPDAAKAALLAVFYHLLEATGLKFSFLPENLHASTFTLYLCAVGLTQYRQQAH